MSSACTYVFVTPWRSSCVCYGCKHWPVHVEGKANMAPTLERFVSPGKGNGLRATDRIKRGELVSSAEPLACCVSNKLSRDVCHHCLTRWDGRSPPHPAVEVKRCHSNVSFVSCVAAAWSVFMVHVNTLNVKLRFTPDSCASPLSVSLCL